MQLRIRKVEGGRVTILVLIIHWLHEKHTVVHDGDIAPDGMADDIFEEHLRNNYYTNNIVVSKEEINTKEQSIYG